MNLSTTLKLDMVAASAHAKQCLDAKDGWEEETLSNNIESNYPDLPIWVCEALAEIALS